MIHEAACSRGQLRTNRSIGFHKGTQCVQLSSSSEEPEPEADSHIVAMGIGHHKRAVYNKLDQDMVHDFDSVYYEVIKQAKLTREEVGIIASRTTEQSDDETWRNMRSNMITASNFERVSSRQFTLNNDQTQTADRLVENLINPSTFDQESKAALRYRKRGEEKARKYTKHIRGGKNIVT
ncbi:unnamed protein product [Owenia fusiformis]|uniref:Uncharacterized protein n=1 Tax=Owenia fusiformis TaxID=6347 RepID=A0A8S4Q403_OWEFU|nr:unnamed protein product [Owenia fusiformis]